MSLHPLRQDIYSVSRLNTEIRAVLEGSFPLVLVEGEISNLSLPKSGHAYFSLKDPYAQVRCALFRAKRQLLRFSPKDGDKVLVRARISFYEARGDFQLLVEHMEPAGQGDLQLQFEQLKQKLAQEGLFDTARKKPIPEFPKQLGVITSPSGAAVRDILQVLKRRFPALPIVIYPSSVQGSEAPSELLAALNKAIERKECDLLILARGGGSLEDLAAFNDETLARAVAASPIPVISAVGHETDFSIADFVADMRAPTPSAAAELASPDREQLNETLNYYEQRIGQSLQGYIQRHQRELSHLQHKLLLLSPEAKTRQKAQRLDDLEARLQHALSNRLARSQQRLGLSNARLQAQSPVRVLRLHQQRLDYLHQRLAASWPTSQAKRTQRLAALAREMHTLSPLNVLARGYSVTLLAESGKVLSSASQTQAGDLLLTRLHQGEVLSVVQEQKPN